MGEIHIKNLEECRDIKSPKELEKYDLAQIDNLYAMHQDIQRELVFHDTVPLPEEQLPQARKRASAQKDAILDYFRQRYAYSFTPVEVWGALVNNHKPFIDLSILLTSVRRAISDLTKEGKLIKCDYSERREGNYGHPNRTWRYNRNFVNPLNPKK